MPRKHTWKLLARDLTEADADLFLQAMKGYTAAKSQSTPCTSCASGTPHSMRYRLLSCACTQCKVVAPFAACPWRGKMLTCLESKLVTLSERGAHFAAVKPHMKPTISRIQRAFIEEMTRENLTPLRILHAMTRKFEKTLLELPELRKVQNAANHYRRKKLGGNDRVRDLTARVVAAAFTGQEDDHDAFTFTHSTDGFGKPVIGDGSNSNPFVVGVTTKALLRSADRDLSTFVLHIDATYKLAQASYPVIVVGMSDGARKFHLLALFISSQLEDRHYTEALTSLQTAYAKVVGKPMNVSFVMGDADKAQFNGIKNAFSAVCNYTFLMCFYHVVAKVRLVLKERTHGLHGDIMAEVYRGVYDLHFTISEDEFLSEKNTVIAKWSTRPELANFRAYMEKQWLKGRFCNWQAYATPSGFATTNNPCETFNRAFKRDYTQRRRLKLSMLLQQMRFCCSHRSMAPVSFEHRRASDKRLIARSTALRRGGFLSEHTFSKSTISFLVDDAGEYLVRVLAIPALRFYVPSRGRSEEALDVAAQFSANYARMEIEEQPGTGWPVNLEAMHCPCRYHAKMEDCVHLQFALQVRNYVDGDGERLMVNRSKKRRSDDESNLIHLAVGRPRLAGHALQRD